MLTRARVAIAYRWRHGVWPNLDTPRRFTEWVQWRKLNDRDENRARLTDKAHGKRVAAAALGTDFMTPTLWQGVALPCQAPWAMPFVIKSNHGCGQFLVVRTPADYDRALKVAPRWLRSSYGGWLDEWHYKAARRSILVEPYVGATDALPIDYKIYVFGGRATMVQMHECRGERHRWSQYDRSWVRLSATAGTAPAPSSLDKMLAAAERLGADHDFLRVDFYEVGGQPLFGEFCLYPGSGLDPFDPPELDDWLGAQWSAQYPARQIVGGLSGTSGTRDPDPATAR